MENLEAMIENENTKEEIEQCTENQLKRSRTESLGWWERERSRWCWARRKKNLEEIRRRKKNPRNGYGDEEERREGGRKKEKRI